MSDYKTALSQSTIQAFIDKKRTFNIDIGKIIGLAWKDATANILNTLIIGLIIGSLSFISPWLIAGLFIGKYDERVNKKPFEIGTLFKGFDHGMPILKYILIVIVAMIAIMFLASLPTAVLLFLGIESMLLAGITNLIMFIIIVFFGTSLYFSLPFIVFADLEPVEAIKASVKIIKQNFLTVFLFSFVIGIVAQLGIIACFVGIYFTLPIAYFGYYYAFNDVFQIENGAGNNDDIIKHLV